MRRLFLGLGLDAEVARALLRPVHGLLDPLGDDVRIYDEDDLHLTLCFFGAVEEERVSSIVRTARDEFRGLFAPELRVGGETDAFPSRDAPRAVWLSAHECAETAGRLAALRNRALQVGLCHGWRPAAAERDRPFRPHVTVARPRNGHGVPDELWHLGVDRRWLPVDVTLFESLSGRNEGPNQPRYRTVASWPLPVLPG